jgi:hypothetical protein
MNEYLRTIKLLINVLIDDKEKLDINKQSEYLQTIKLLVNSLIYNKKNKSLQPIKLLINVLINDNTKLDINKQNEYLQAIKLLINILINDDFNNFNNKSKQRMLKQYNLLCDCCNIDKLSVKSKTNEELLQDYNKLIKAMSNMINIIQFIKTKTNIVTDQLGWGK